MAALDDHLTSRAVVARMKVVPETARSLHGELFGDYFRRSLQTEESVSGKRFFTSSNQVVMDGFKNIHGINFERRHSFCGFSH